MNYEKIIEFISIVYHPNKFPLPQKKFVKVLKGIFPKKEEQKLIYNNFIFSSGYYWIETNNHLFKPLKYAKEACKILKNKQQSNFIWSIAIAYNNYDSKNRFYQAISKYLKDKKVKSIFCELLYKEINGLKDIELYKENYYNLQNLKQDFQTYNNLNRIGWELESIVKPSIANLLDILCVVNKSKWNGTLKNFKSPFIITILNLYYLSRKRKNNHNNLFDFSSKSGDDIITLAIFNCFNLIIEHSNKTLIIKNLLSRINQLNYKRFYWYGIILSNAEYHIHNEEILIKINKIIRKNLIKELKNAKNKVVTLRYLQNGLKPTPRNTSYKYLNIYNEFLEIDKSLSVKLMQIIVDNYANIITNKRCYIPYFSINENTDKNGVEYTNSVIHAVAQLVSENKLDILEYFNKLLGNFHLSREDYLYNFSKMISEKTQVLHIFIVLLYVIENLEKTSCKIDGNITNTFFDKFIEYINIHLQYENEDLIASLDYIFNLKISLENNMIYKAIATLTNHAIPPFKSLAILISKVSETHEAKEYLKFIENYFDKYHQYWLEIRNNYKSYKFKEWYDIWIILKDKDRAKICINEFPKHKQQKYLEVIEKI